MAGNPPDPRRILILKPSSLGDIIHALPTANLIRRRYPSAHIAWLVNTAFTSLLKNCPVINEIIPFPRHNLRQLPALVKRLRQARYDLVVDLQGLLRSGLLAAATGAPRRLGLSDAREGAGWLHNEIVTVTPQHAIDRYLLAARHLGGAAGPIEFPLGLIPEFSPAGWIAINASARWKTKLWGDEKFAELIRQLPQDRVVLTGSAAEADRIKKIAQGCRCVAGQTDLLELAELYRRCAVVVTNDSGPMHLAAAVGTPVIAIFGPTAPALTGPYGDRHIVLRAGVACSPCFKDSCANPVVLECMQRISITEVRSAVQKFI